MAKQEIKLTGLNGTEYTIPYKTDKMIYGDLLDILDRSCDMGQILLGNNTNIDLQAYSTGVINARVVWPQGINLSVLRRNCDIEEMQKLATTVMKGYEFVDIVKKLTVTLGVTSESDKKKSN